MRNGRLDELQAGIKIGRRNINNLRYAGDTTLVAESEEELKGLLMRVKEESGKACLKLNIIREPMGICCMTQGTQTQRGNNLEGWNGAGGGRDVQVGGDMSIPMAGSY